MAEAETETPTETAPFKVRESDGVALDGDYPHNHRLRAEALAADGKTSDPDGLVSDELIADAGERVRRIEEAEAEARRLDNRSKADLEEIAAREGVDLTAAKSNADRVALIEDARAKAEAALEATRTPTLGSVTAAEPGSASSSSEEV